MGKGGSVSVPTDYKFSFGGTGSTISVDADLDNVRVKEFPRFELAVTEYPKLEVDTDLSVKELPRIELDTNSKLNAKLNIAITEIPDTRIHLPSHYCVGLALFGVEIWKLSFCGESQVINEKYVPRKTEMNCE